MMRNTIRLVVAAVLLALPLAAGAQVGVNQNLVDANQAPAADLSGLPHLTPALADALVDGRPFASMLAVDAVLTPALSAAQREELYGRLFLPLNLNTASEAEILLVPGVGDRMAHEFEEYRPYVALAQFRREIGKYVDETEVARLEQYVFMPMHLNTASDEAFLSIPGVGARMLREFKEYRPYTSLAQFRREIGKYVDETQVAIWERYVTLD
jgi:DNA uptake protein ComE-like DNA-binding protein